MTNGDSVMCVATNRTRFHGQGDENNKVLHSWTVNDKHNVQVENAGKTMHDGYASPSET